MLKNLVMAKAILGVIGGAIGIIGGGIAVCNGVAQLNQTLNNQMPDMVDLGNGVPLGEMNPEDLKEVGG